MASAALLVVSPLAACGSGNTAVGSPQPLTSIAASAATGSSATSQPAQWARVTPSVLKQYSLTPTEFATIGQARDILTASCMERFGFDFPVPDFASEKQLIQNSEDESEMRLFGITDRAVAEKYGYMPASLYRDSSAEETPAYQDSPAYQKVLNAGKLPGMYLGEVPVSVGKVDGQEIPPGGCAGQAMFKLSGDYDGYSSQLGRKLWIQSFTRAEADPGWRAAVDDWARCLAGKGYHVTSPLSDKGDIEQYTAGDDNTMPSKAEIALALADIDCKEKTNLVHRLNAIDNKYGEKMVEENQLALRADYKYLEGMVKKASAVVQEDAG